MRTALRLSSTEGQQSVQEQRLDNDAMSENGLPLLPLSVRLRVSKQPAGVAGSGGIRYKCGRRYAAYATGDEPARARQTGRSEVQA